MRVARIVLSDAGLAEGTFGEREGRVVAPAPDKASAAVDQGAPNRGPADASFQGPRVSIRSPGRLPPAVANAPWRQRVPVQDGRRNGDTRA